MKAPGSTCARLFLMYTCSPSRIRVSAAPAGRSLLPTRWYLSADFGWIPRGALSSCTPSKGTYGCYGWCGGWTEGVFVFLSTVVGLACSFDTPYVQCLTEGPQPWCVQRELDGGLRHRILRSCGQGLRYRSPWFGTEVDGVDFWGPAHRCRARLLLYCWLCRRTATRVRVMLE